MTVLDNVEGRHEYLSAFQDSKLSAQIQVLRESAGLTRLQLAERLRTTEAQVAALESGESESWNLSTLRRVARFFDVGLVVEFGPMTDALDRVHTAGSKNLKLRPGVGFEGPPSA